MNRPITTKKRLCAVCLKSWFDSHRVTRIVKKISCVLHGHITNLKLKCQWAIQWSILSKWNPYLESQHGKLWIIEWSDLKYGNLSHCTWLASNFEEYLRIYIYDYDRYVFCLLSNLHLECIQYRAILKSHQWIAKGMISESTQFTKTGGSSVQMPLTTNW